MPKRFEVIGPIANGQAVKVHFGFVVLAVPNQPLDQLQLRIGLLQMCHRAQGDIDLAAVETQFSQRKSRLVFG